MTTAPHPLVAALATKWQAVANRHGVKTYVEPMTDLLPDGLTIQFETSFSAESAYVMIFPPSTPGGRSRQAPMIAEYYNGPGGRMRFGCRRVTRDVFMSRLVHEWSRRAKVARKRELVAA